MKFFKKIFSRKSLLLQEALKPLNDDRRIRLLEILEKTIVK